MQKMVINLWFDKEAEDAANFYCGIFKDSELGRVTHYPNTGQEITGGEPGSVMTVEYELNGMSFLALNGGPLFKFNEAMSIVIYCDTQEEVDYYWGKLSAVPEAEQCGWLKDKFGVVWQVTPKRLDELLTSDDKAANERVMAAMLKMHKLDIAGLEAAAEGR